MNYPSVCVTAGDNHAILIKTKNKKENHHDIFMRVCKALRDWGGELGIQNAPHYLS